LLLKNRSPLCPPFFRIALLILICLPLHLSADEQEENEAPPIDWSKPVVSRDFGEQLSAEQSRPDLEQGFKTGQVAYYFANYAEALQHWMPLAEQGYAAAQANIGWMYQAGLGLDVDIDKARAWYEKAAKQGHAVAQNNLAVLYEYGNGVKKNFTQAYALYLASARQGYRFAQYNLAVLLLEGKGTERNLQEALDWLRKASQQGVDKASSKLEQLGSGPEQQKE